MGSPHGGGEGDVPGALILDRLTLRKPHRQRLDQRPLRPCDAAGKRQRRLSLIIGDGEVLRLRLWVLLIPWIIIVRPGGIGDAPMRHRAVRIGRQRVAETNHRLLVVKAEAPVQPPVEPKLRIGRGGGDFPRIGPDVIGIVHVASGAVGSDVLLMRQTSRAGLPPPGRQGGGNFPASIPSIKQRRANRPSPEFGP